MSVDRFQETLRDVLISFTDQDWWGIEVILGPAIDFVGNDGPEFRRLVRDVLAHLFHEGLAEAGAYDTLYEVEGSSPEVLERVIADLEERGWEPRGAGYWLVGTEKGVALGNKWLREDKQSGRAAERERASDDWFDKQFNLEASSLRHDNVMTKEQAADSGHEGTDGSRR